MKHTDYPFSNTYSEVRDLELIEEAVQGSRVALEELIKRHQDYIYNVALKILMNPLDAEDLTQEVLIKVITKLSQFRGKSAFRTWLYRITFNHFLSSKKGQFEEFVTSFDAFGESLDNTPDIDLTPEEKIEMKELVEEAKLGCMSGMLLCLTRDQRLVFVLGELFGVDHNLGGELLDITPANFRKKLERARRDLYNFMQRKCGLINKNNPCRCARKTKGFIQQGWVTPGDLLFNIDYIKRIHDIIPEKQEKYGELVHNDYKSLFQAHPYQEKPVADELRRTILTNPKVIDVFDLKK